MILKIIKPNEKVILNNYGMPKSINEYGNLIIKFNVIFPNVLPDKNIEILKDIL